MAPSTSVSRLRRRQLGVPDAAVHHLLQHLRTGGARANYEPLGYNGDGTNFSDSFHLFGNVVKIHGNHTLKFGGPAREPLERLHLRQSLRHLQLQCRLDQRPGRRRQRHPFGQDLAPFLLGLPSGGSLDLNSQTTVQARYLGLFLNDDWRVSPDLTLSLGLRWERDFPETERFNRVSTGSTRRPPVPSPPPRSRLRGAPAALSGQPLQGARRTDLPLGDHRVSTTPTRPSSVREPASPGRPPVGNKTVIRGGIGVLVDPLPAARAQSQQGFSQQHRSAAITTAAACRLPGPIPSRSASCTRPVLAKGTHFPRQQHQLLQPEH